MKQMRNVIKTTVFVLIGAILLVVVQSVLIPTDKKQFENIFLGSEALEPESLEIVLLGTSHMGGGISPMKLYEEANITAYNYGTSVQRLDEGYYILEDVMKDQSPSLVVIDVSTLFNSLDDQLGFRRYLLESVPMGTLKLELARQYAEYDEDGGMVEALFPIIEYHSGWEELSNQSFEPQDNFYFLSTAGYTLSRLVAGTSATQEEIDLEAESIAASEVGYSIAISEGERTQESIEEAVYAPEIGETELEWLLKIEALCEENGAELLLIKIPTRISAVDYPGAWTKYKSALVKDMAKEHELIFYDLTYDSDLEIDYAVETGDGGMHLNLKGAEKATECLLEYVQENYELTGMQNKHYDKMLQEYQILRDVVSLQLETEFQAYIERLSEMEDVTIFISASKEWTTGMTEQDYASLGALGLELVKDAQWGDAYVAIVDNGELIHEQVSNRKIEYEYTYDYENAYEHEKIVEICSAGYFYHGVGTSIKVDDIECGINGLGLNIVVMDNESGLVYDSVNFNTTSEAKVGSHYMRVASLPEME